MSSSSAHGRACSIGVSEPEDGDEEGHQSADPLTLLDDEYARAILRAVRSEPKPAREILSEVDASRSTVYRRLDQLEAAGLLRTDLAYDPDGHHRTVFEASLGTVSVEITPEGLSVETSPGAVTAAPGRPDSLRARGD
ncbi:MAG: ArsR/SmtB family transcription factor [Salinirussus sp.]